ncbi:MAG: 1-phosphofructokinase family hexose kinase [Lachnospiraceae bacterium]|nr:1-phosphofructokinase family hexose kinase [Lachnospiraceae bacterium]
MSIITVTLNPCIDRTITITKPIEIGGTHRVEKRREEVSGKGLNVSYLLKNWNVETKCVGFDFKGSDYIVKKTLDELEIPNELLAVEGQVRCNIKVFDDTCRTMTEFNEKGFPVSEKDYAQFIAQMDELIGKLTEEDILVLTGSVPPGIPADVYKGLIQKAKVYGIKTVLDASGELIKCGVEAIPFAMKPNKEELEMLLGYKPETMEEIGKACKILLDKGVEYICVTLGDKGALLACTEGIYKAEPLKLDVKGIQGAGDSVVAGMCTAIQEGKAAETILRYAMAAAGGSLILEGTQMCRLEDFHRLLPQVKIESIKI